MDDRTAREWVAPRQVLRMGVLKQLAAQSDEALAVTLVDSETYRGFCCIGFERKPVVVAHGISANGELGEPSDGELLGTASVLSILRIERSVDESSELLELRSPQGAAEPTVELSLLGAIDSRYQYSLGLGCRDSLRRAAAARSNQTLLESFRGMARSGCT